jgi:CRISPR-associated endonuclease/helicase Cas3
MMEEPIDIARLALNLDENGGCICVIMNTVLGAQRVYNELEKLSSPDTKILLYHSRFKANRRAEIEHLTLELFDKRSLLPAGNPEKTERPKKAILVATQVVEQSLDLDFDEMITELAPIDLILQRTGRLHRHNRTARPTGTQPKLHVLFPKAGVPRFGSTEAIYNRFTLLKTIQALSSLETFNLPSDIKRLINFTYNNAIDNLEISPYSITVPDLKESHDRMEIDIEEKAGLSNQYMIDDPRKSEYSIALKQGACSFGEDDEGTRNYFNARTRIADDTITVILLNDNEYADLTNSDTPPKKSALKQVFMNMVSLPEWWLREVVPLDDHEPIAYGKKWLMSMSILRLRSGEWRGKGKNGQFTIMDDARLGIVREEIKQ